MMVMTAKVNMKKIALILGAAAALILGLTALFGGGEQPTSAVPVSGNDARVQFLENLGWDVTTSPKESSQVRIPEEATEVFDRYNQLQKSQGYDLNDYAGKKVMRYVYEVNNYPGAQAPVYATLLVYRSEVIGGDITDTAAGGQVRGFRMPGASQEATQPAA